MKTSTGINDDDDARALENWELQMMELEERFRRG